MTCPECNNKRYIIEDGEKVACNCVKLQRLGVYFPDLAKIKKIDTELLTMEYGYH